MHKKKVFWFSPNLGRELTVVRWGHLGRPLVLFPTAGGDAEECERMLMIRALSPLIDEGRLKVYSCDHIAGWHWIDEEVPAARKVEMQRRYDLFIEHELLRVVRADCRDPEIRPVVAGYSLGGFQAFAAACRHPRDFSTAICMSSPYDLSGWVEGHHSEDFHHTSPMHFLPYATDPAQLEALRQTSVLLVHGRGPFEKPWRAWGVADVLGRVGVPNRVDIWGPEHDHDWVAWRDQLPHYMEQLTRQT